jgi:hypothetical protein
MSPAPTIRGHCKVLLAPGPSSHGADVDQWPMPALIGVVGGDGKRACDQWGEVMDGWKDGTSGWKVEELSLNGLRQHSSESRGSTASQQVAQSFMPLMLGDGCPPPVQ